MSSLYIFFKHFICCYDDEKESLKNKIRILEMQLEEQRKEIEGYKLCEKLKIKNEGCEEEIVIETN